mmetsp:Transcript_48359/g.128956  ORF Transcript_48359/g.128956 Transcript_48359/m.128956 type:complete len:245 (+) Transcript_48359:373-1107(+)
MPPDAESGRQPAGGRQLLGRLRGVLPRPRGRQPGRARRLPAVRGRGPGQGPAAEGARAPERVQRQRRLPVRARPRQRQDPPAARGRGRGAGGDPRRALLRGPRARVRAAPHRVPPDAAFRVQHPRDGELRVCALVRRGRRRSRRAADAVHAARGVPGRERGVHVAHGEPLCRRARVARRALPLRLEPRPRLHRGLQHRPGGGHAQPRWSRARRWVYPAKLRDHAQWRLHARGVPRHTQHQYFCR